MQSGKWCSRRFKINDRGGVDIEATGADTFVRRVQQEALAAVLQDLAGYDRSWKQDVQPQFLPFIRRLSLLYLQVENLGRYGVSWRCDLPDMEWVDHHIGGWRAEINESVAPPAPASRNSIEEWLLSEMLRTNTFTIPELERVIEWPEGIEEQLCELIHTPRS